MIYISFAIVVLIFHSVCVILNTLLLAFSKTLYTSVVNFPALTSEHITSGTRKLQKRTRTFHPNRNMKDVLLLHDNAWPHTSLRTREAIAKMWWTFLPHPADSPDLAPSDYRLFYPVKDARRGRHFCRWQRIETKFSWSAPKSRQRILQHWNTASYSTLWKNSLVIAEMYESSCKFHYNCNYIFWEKTGGITHVPPLVAGNREQVRMLWTVRLAVRPELSSKKNDHVNIRWLSFVKQFRTPPRLHPKMLNWACCGDHSHAKEVKPIMVMYV
jgi:hypothetical protein